MKNYRTELLNYHDSIQGREPIEWANFWYDHSNEKLDNRILLIGDSSLRMIRSTLANVYQGAVDFFGTSSGLHDELFIAQLEAFFSTRSYTYNYIFVQLGHHSRIGDCGKTYSDEDYLKFDEDYRVLVSYLQQYSEMIILNSIFYSVHAYKMKIQQKLKILLRIKDKYDDDINFIKEKKNKIIKKVADDNQVLWLDINQAMIQTKYLHYDHIHYENKAKKCIVSLMLKKIEMEALR